VSLPKLAASSAADLGRRLARRELSPVEVVADSLARIERFDPKLNSFLTVTGESALADARTAEAEIAAGRHRGPLHGVPLGLKDIFDTAGVRTTSGSRILTANVPARDAPVVERLRAAGTIVLGKLNLHEFAYGTTTTNPHFGPCRNPWDLDRVPGGSSGGSGAALAAGLCHLSLGTDTGGSIRVPASVCGGVGLKPTFGRVPRGGVLPLAWSLDHVGPMTRCVEDAALLLCAVAGTDAGDAWSFRDGAEDFTADLERGVRGLTIGIPEPLFFDGLEPDVGQAAAKAIDVLERLGASTRLVTWPNVDRGYTAFHAMLASEASAFHRPWMGARPEDYGADVRAALEIGYFIPATAYLDARRVQLLLRDELDMIFEAADVLVTPALPRTAPPIGEPISREPTQSWTRFLAPFNLTGSPAISVPCGCDRLGLPIGLQIAGRPFDEATVLRVARAYERERGWPTLAPMARD